MNAHGRRVALRAALRRLVTGGAETGSEVRLRAAYHQSWARQVLPTPLLLRMASGGFELFRQPVLLQADGELRDPLRLAMGSGLVLQPPVVLRLERLHGRQPIWGGLRLQTRSDQGSFDYAWSFVCPPIAIDTIIQNIHVMGQMRGLWIAVQAASPPITHFLAFLRRRRGLGRWQEKRDAAIVGEQVAGPAVAPGLPIEASSGSCATDRPRSVARCRRQRKPLEQGNGSAPWGTPRVKPSLPTAGGVFSPRES